MTTDELRAKFEEWCADHARNLSLRKNSVRVYWYADTLQAWELWLAAHASRDAEVEALRKDAERIDALENWCIEGCVDIGIELEGGVYLHLAAIGESDVDYREKNTVREAIDVAREKQP